MSNLLEDFSAANGPSLENLTQLFTKLGKLSRYGGPERVYDIEGQKAAAFAIGEQMAAVAFAWKATPAKVSTIYYWDSFSFERTADYAIDLPDADMAEMGPIILEMIAKHQLGKVDL